MDELLKKLVAGALSPPPMPPPPDVTRLPIPRGLHLIPGANRAWQEAMAGLQADVARFAGQVWVGAFGVGLERGGIWGLVIGLAIGIPTGFKLMSMITQAASQKHAMDARSEGRP